MKFIYFIFVVFFIVLDQVYSDRENSIARRSQVRKREYYTSVPVVVVYDSENSNKKAPSSTEGKFTTTLSSEFPRITTLDIGNQNENVKTTTEKILLTDVPILLKKLSQTRRFNRRNEYEIPVAVVYDSATEPHARQKLEALSYTANPVTTKNIRQRGGKRYKDPQDSAKQQLDKEVKLTTELIEEVTINPIESNTLPKESVKTKTVVQRRRPSKNSQRVFKTAQSYDANEPTITEKILNISENMKSISEEPINYPYSTETAMEITTLLINKSLQGEEILVSSTDNDLIFQKQKPVGGRRRLSKELQRVVQTTPYYDVSEPIVTENILKASENMKFLKKQPIIYENVNANPTELATQITTSSSIDESLLDEQIFYSVSKKYPKFPKEKSVLQTDRPSKEDQIVVETTQSYDLTGPTTAENLSDPSENIQSISIKPIFNNENFKANPTEPVIEATTSSIDESLQDEQIFVSLPKIDQITEEEKSVIRRRRPSKQGLKVPNESNVTENILNAVINENVKANPTELDKELKTASTDESLKNKQKKISSHQNNPTILEEKPKKGQRRTRTRDPVVPIVNSQNFIYQNGEFHYSFEGGDGTKKFENGVLKHNKDDSTGEAVEGGFSYKDKDGKSFSLTYTADENGYRPVGDHLPTPPPIPPAIARALRYLATKPTPVDYDNVTEKLHLQDTEKVQDSQGAN